MLIKNSFSLVGLIVIAFLGCAMELDISIPSFPQIASHFDASEALVQSTLSANFLAFCLSGLLYGPVSDAWGRKRLMQLGASLFLIGAVGCAFSSTMNQLIGWRFVQGLGASSTFVLGFAMISDRYQGDDAATKISMVNAFSTVFMAAAPILGGLISQYFSWRANYTVIALIACISWIMMILFLQETKNDKQPLQFNKIILDYGSILKHREFMMSSLLPNLLVVAYLTFVGSAAFYYITTCHLSPLMFACHQGILVACFSIASFFAGNVIAKIGSQNAVRYGMIGSALGTAMMLLFAYTMPLAPILVTIAMCVFAVGCAFPMCVTFAKSLEIIPSKRGACSSFIMSSRLLLTAVGITFTGYAFDGTMKPVAIVMSISLFIAVLISIKLSNKASTKPFVSNNV